MIRIEDTHVIPTYLWNEISSKEFAMMPYEAHQALLALSNPVKVVYEDEEPLLVAGIYWRSFVSIPYLWVLITAKFRRVRPSTLRVLRAFADIHAPNCETLIEEASPQAVRLALAFSFKPTDSVVLYGDTSYRMYRRGK
jgi:hypothetical protein